MAAELYWMEWEGPGRVAVLPCPLGGDRLEEELRSLHGQGVNVLVSLLTPEEIEDEALGRESEICQTIGIEFHWFPVPDGSVPVTPEPFGDLAVLLAGQLKKGRGIGFHCRAGIGRSPLLAACVLRVMGMSSKESFARLGVARAFPVPQTEEQKRFAADFVVDA